MADSTLITMPFTLADLPARTVELVTRVVLKHAGDDSPMVLDMLGLDRQ